MIEEKRPLLGKNHERNNYEINDESSGSSSNSISSFRIPIYGTDDSIPLGKIIPAKDKITYTWSDINVFLKTTLPFTKRICLCNRERTQKMKQILKNVSGAAYPGELLAILGSSGAGKTTLLNSLTYRSSPNIIVTGKRMVNGMPVTSTSMTSRSAYVQQDDLFIGALTVREHLIFQAMLRMDPNLTYTERIKRVNEVISELALTKCQDSMIGIRGRIKGISGGEMKRLSFAAEVLTNPALMFCDEPTSGLDSYMALNIVQELKKLTKTGKTIICTIHQPSSELYAQFDKLLLMTEGRVAFLGTPEEADTFFNGIGASCPRNYNPADFFIQLLAIVPGKVEACRKAVNSICDSFETSPLGAKYYNDIDYPDIEFEEVTSRSPYKASWCSQFRAVMWRSWLGVRRDPLLLKIRFVQTMIVSLIILIVYFNQKLDYQGAMNLSGALFLYLTNMSFQNIFAVINIFCGELPVFLREHRNGMYRCFIYFICKTLAELPIFILIPIAFVAISYHAIGFRPDIIHFSIACLIVTLVANVATSFGYMISGVTGNIQMALAMGAPLSIPFLLLGGFFLNVSSIPSYLRWISWLSWYRFSYEGLMINQWHNVTDIYCPPINATCPQNGDVILETYSFDPTNLPWDILYLVLLIVGFRFVAFVGLWHKTL